MPAIAATAPMLPAEPDRVRPLAAILAAWLIAMAIMALWVTPVAVTTVKDGVLFDNDDAMRLVQLREWMGGKPWYDVTQSRVDPPASPIAHWPRLIELPIAALILALRTVAAPETAERIAIAAWPIALLALFTFLLLRHAGRFYSTPALLVGAVAIGFNPLLLFQLLPGRIDHHGVQMVLALLLLILVGDAAIGGRRASAALAGLAAALMLAIGLETAPLVATGAACVGAGWIWSGRDKRASTALFGIMLALGSPVLFGLSIDPSRWTATACDALSPPWLWLAVAGGGALALLAALPQPKRLPVRAAFAFGAAGGVCAIFLLAWPQCLAGPYASVDPLVRALWLSHVGEARPVLRLALENPSGFLFFAVYLVVGWAALALAALRDGRSRPELLVLLAFGSAATLVALAEMRGAPFAAMFCAFGWLFILDRAFGLFGSHSSLLANSARGVAVVVAILAALPFGWGAMGAAITPPPPLADHGGCRTPSDLAALAREPAGLVLAPIRLGPRILAATPHSILGAPYHRNNSGNRTALQELTASASAAERLLRDRGVAYVALCLDDPDLPTLESAGADPLIRSLVEGPAPGWLEPVETAGPVRAWRVR